MALNSISMYKDNLYLDFKVELFDGSQPYEMISEGTQGWYAPREYLRQLPGVVGADYIDTTSSAGDWSGWYALESENGFSLVLFSQENRFPNHGYTLYTGDRVIAEVESLDAEVVNEAIEDYMSAFENTGCSDVWDDLWFEDGEELDEE